MMLFIIILISITFNGCGKLWVKRRAPSIPVPRTSHCSRPNYYECVTFWKWKVSGLEDIRQNRICWNSDILSVVLSNLSTLHQYDRVIITDLITCTLDLIKYGSCIQLYLDPSAERYGGITHRHVVLSKRFVRLPRILKRMCGDERKCLPASAGECESFGKTFEMAFAEYRRIGYFMWFSFVMYAIREWWSTWSEGEWDADAVYLSNILMSKEKQFLLSLHVQWVSGWSLQTLFISRNLTHHICSEYIPSLAPLYDMTLFSASRESAIV